MKVTNQKYFNITENHCKKNKRYIELLSVLNNEYQVKEFYPTEMKNILIDDLSNMGWVKNKKAFKNSNAKVQIYSEKIGESTIPVIFWYLSIFGGLGLLIYAFSRKDPVIITGQLFGIFIYARNLILIYRKKKDE